MVVTGISGLLGSNFAVSATDCFAVTGFYNQHPVRIPSGTGLAVDLLSTTETRDRLNAIRPQVLVHFAALTKVDHCERHPEEAVRLNVEVTRRLAEWAASNRCRFLLMSTDSIFDGRHGGYTEADEPRPINRYAASKFAAEQVVRALVPDHLIVRANIYGWNTQPKSSFGEWIVARLEAREAVPGFTDVIFAPLLVNTLTEFMLKLLNREATGTYHLASRDSASKFEFAVALAEFFGFSKSLVKPATLADAQLPAPRPLNTSLRADFAQREFNLTLPTVREDLLRFKLLRDDGYLKRLKSLCTVNS